jgi:cytochrome c-type biogenesis protein CcmF
MTIAGYTLRLDGTSQVQGPNYVADRADITVLRDGQVLTVVHPEKRRYPVEQTETTQSSIRTTIVSDLYVVLGDSRPGGGWVIRAYVSPMAPFIWIGGVIMALAGMIALGARIAARIRAARSVAAGAAEPAS